MIIIYEKNDGEFGSIWRWSGDEDTASLLDINGGKVLAHFSHDGHGKWESWVCLPLWKAWQTSRSDVGIGVWRLASFPRFWVFLRTMRSAEGAVAQVEHALGLPTGIHLRWESGEEDEEVAR